MENNAPRSISGAAGRESTARHIIGIDFGNHTCVCAGTSLQSPLAVEIIPNRLSNRQTPCVAGVSQTGRLTGEEAETRSRHTGNFFRVSPFMICGADSDEINIYKRSQDSGYEWSPHGVAVLVGTGKDKKLVPALSAVVLYLRHLVANSGFENAKRSLVVSVPDPLASNHDWRMRFEGFSKLAGYEEFETLYVVPHSLSAVLGWEEKHLHRASSEEQNSLVGKVFGILDVGYSHVTMTIFSVIEESGKIRSKILVTRSSTELGHAQIISRISDYVGEKLMEAGGADYRKSARIFHKIRVACENAIQKLSAYPKTRIELDAALEDADFSMDLTLDDIENAWNIQKEIFEAQIRDAVAEGEAEGVEMESLFLIGNASRVPFIEERLRDMFPNRWTADTALRSGVQVSALIT